MENNTMDNRERLQKIIANAGVCSRRKAEEMIADGLVRVNGTVAQIGDLAQAGVDEIEVSGTVISSGRKLIYIMLNKPKGYVTTADDEMGRPNVTQLVESVGRRLYPVGRLDMHSEGLLIMTNDGDFTYRLTHPKHNFYKEYIVKIIAPKGENPVEKLAQPMDLDGYTIVPPIVKMISETPRGYMVSIKIQEGRNRQIRKMCQICGYRVEALRRVAVGDVRLGTLKEGEFRDLTAQELENLK